MSEPDSMVEEGPALSGLSETDAAGTNLIRRGMDVEVAISCAVPDRTSVGKQSFAEIFKRDGILSEGAGTVFVTVCSAEEITTVGTSNAVPAT